MRKKRLLWQLYPSYLLITFIALVAVTWDAWGFIKQSYLEQTQRDLAARARLVQHAILPALTTGDYRTIDTLCKLEGRETATRITVILASGKVVADSNENPAAMDNHRSRPEVLNAFAQGLGVSTRRSHTLREDMMYVAIPVQTSADAVAVVRTALSLSTIDHALLLIATKLIIGMLLIAVAAAVVSLLVARRISRPLEDMTRIATHFAQGDLAIRLPAQETAEMAELAEAMNHMAVQLDERIRTAIRQRNEQEAMLLSMTEGVLAVDNDERLLKLNQAAAGLLGVNPVTAQGRSIQEVIRNSDLQQFVARVLDSHEPLEGEIILRDHGEQYMQIHGTLLQDEDGNRIGALVVMNDVTHLRRLETIRRDFVGNVSHELKTPVTSIKGFVETLLDGSAQDPQDVQRFLGIIAKHTERLNAIIEDLLSLSRLDQQSENTSIMLTEHPLRRILATSLQNCEYKAQQKQIQMSVECDESLRARVNAPLLEQAVTNLIDNAIKYSDVESRIRIEALREQAETVIRVHDQGCGIAREHLPRLFERFYRVDTGRSRKLGGTGLGLAIVKHIAQAHHGRVSVESVIDQGSIFSIHLP